MSENSENKYLRKRQAGVKQDQKKSVPKKISKPNVPPKKPPVPTRKPSKPTAPKPSPGKPVIKPQASKTTRRPTSGRRPTTPTQKRPTSKPLRSTTKSAPKPTPKRPVAPPKKPSPNPITSRKTSRPAAITRNSTPTKTSTTTTRLKVTRNPTTAITTTTSASTSTFKPTRKIHLGKYEYQILELIKNINEARRLHQAQELEIDQELSNEAQILATQSARNQENIPDKDSTVGLLTYYSWPKEPLHAFSHWYGGSYGFNYDDPEKITKYNASFTQLVWRSSKKIGCGIDKTTDDEFFAACLLSPKGNKKGEFKENVRDRIDKVKRI
uniref:SCP domain-containing protein n=1 Tax=Strongyloides papillosus TaxID=174720 RepID=A0A0N5BU76_STREA